MGQVNINNSVTLLIVKMITVNDSLIVSSVGQNSSRNRKWTNMISVAGSYVTFSLHLFSTVVILRKRCIKCFLCWLCLNKIPEWWECWSIISLNQFIHISVRPRKNSILQFCIMSELWWESPRAETFQDALLLWNEVNAGMPFENEPIHAQTQGRERRRHHKDCKMMQDTSTVTVMLSSLMIVLHNLQTESQKICISW